MSRSLRRRRWTSTYFRPRLEQLEDRLAPAMINPEPGTIVITAIGNQTVTSGSTPQFSVVGGQQLSLTVQAQEIQNPDQPILFEPVSASGSLIPPYSILPPGASFSSDGGVFTWTPTQDQTASITVEATVTGDTRVERITPAFLTFTVDVTPPPAVVAAPGAAVTATEGTPTGSLVLATFTDAANPDGTEEPLSNYSATVNWGDGVTSDPATIQFDTNTDQFEVLGSHTYTNVDDVKSSQVVVTINHEDTTQQTVNDPLTVTDPPVIASAGAPVTATDGTSTGNLVLATFTDPGDPTATIEQSSAYSATINWGDGVTADRATIDFNSTTQQYEVYGSHTYFESVDPPSSIVVTVDHESTLPQVATDDLTLVEPNVSATAGADVTATAGTSTGTLVLATFTDAGNPNGNALSGSDYSATINWGDGLTNDPATIAFNTTTQKFEVEGSHTYFESTIPPTGIVVTINHDATLAQMPTDGLTINDPTIVAASGADVTATAGTITGTLVLATFTDAGNPNGNALSASDYSATINWGDGLTNDPATIAFNTTTQKFEVEGGHTYFESTTPPTEIVVTINHDATPAQTKDDGLTIQAPAVVASAGADVTATAGTITGTLVLATFTDAGNPNGNALSASDYSATINWGDGLTNDPATITFNSTTQKFEVEGSHTYFESTTPPTTIVVTINHDATLAQTKDDGLTIEKPAVVASAGANVTTTAGTSTGTLVLATFTDAGNPNGNALSASDYSATINWGDGLTNDPATISFNTTTQKFEVEGSHTYFESTNPPTGIVVTINHDATLAQMPTDGLTINDPTIVAASGADVTATAGTSTGTLVLATFTDAGNPNGNALSASDYSATINWGDGLTNDPATITFNTTTQKFEVEGSHTYFESTTPPTTIVVTINHDATLAQTKDDGLTIEKPAVVASAGANVTVTAGTSTGTLVLATFTDAGNPNGNALSASDYSATINWGDGLTNDPATITFNSTTQKFEVEGSHTYFESTTPPTTIVVTINHDATLAQTKDDGLTIEKPAVVASAGADVTVTAGTSTGTLVLATFTDAGNPNGNALSASDYSATINWGDGLTNDPATISFNTTTQKFEVEGSHTYFESTNPPTDIVVTINHEATLAQMPTDGLTINDPTIVAASGAAVTATAGTSTGTLVLATFTDAGNPNGNALSASDYSATINWGDGLTNDPATISFNTTTQKFEVEGSHTYFESTTPPTTIVVTINHDATLAQTKDDGLTIEKPAVVASAGADVTATAGTSTGTLVLATFTDPGNPNGNALSASDYSATINWGDGLTNDPATITFNSTTQKFEVEGSHTYFESTTPPTTIVVTINHDATLAQTKDDGLTIEKPAVVASAGADVTATAGTGTGTLVLTTFTDAGNPNGNALSASDYSATINWGDGLTNDPATISFNTTTQKFEVEGGHTYFESTTPPTTIVVTINHDATLAQTKDDGLTIEKPAVVASAGANVTATAGTSTGTLVLTTFTDAGNPNGNALSASDYSATINWGDGLTNDPATITFNSTTQKFEVEGSHTYSESTTPPTEIVVTINHDATLAQMATDGLTINDSTIVAVSGANVTATAGTSTGTLVLATFTDAGNPNGNALSGSDYSATINWGDGLTNDPATIAFNTTTQRFEVKGSHTYFESTTPPSEIVVTINHEATPAQTKDVGLTIEEPAVVASAGANVTATAGTSTGTLVLATFTDAGNPNGNALSASDYSATINWGDGLTNDPATITFNTTTQKFEVEGSHTYSESTTPPTDIVVTINHDATLAQMATDGLTINDSTIVAVSGANVTATAGTSTGTLVLATFTDAGNPNGNAILPSDYSATINWGDGLTNDPATIAFNKTTQKFEVKGSHTYFESTTPPTEIVVTINHDATPAQTKDVGLTIEEPAVVASAGANVTATAGTSTGTLVLATFTDAGNPNGNALSGSDYSATINWGDGLTNDPATISFNTTTQKFEVEGSHTYFESTTQPTEIVVTIDHEATLAQMPTVGLTINDSTIVAASGAAVTATAGTSTGTLVLATFTDAGNPNGNALSGSDYSATINWGDGLTNDPATISFNTTAQKFEVEGSHTYFESTTPPTEIVVTINHDATPAQTKDDGLTIEEPAVVASAGADVTATAGTSTGTLVLATFTDTGNPNGNAILPSNYSATINWGDGLTDDPATIQFNSATDRFEVLGSHTYTNVDNLTADNVVVTINHEATTAQLVQDALSVTVPAVEAAAGATVTATEAISTGDVLLATFTDSANPSGKALQLSDYSADIDWGDGTGVQAGKIQFNAKTLQYEVTGSHTYVGVDGVADQITVTIHHQTALDTTVDVPLTLIDPPVQAVAGSPVTAVEGTSTGDLVLATFTDPGDPNVTEPSSAYSATIDWGDGTANDTGKIVYNTTTQQYEVHGNHAYADADDVTGDIVVTINHDKATPQAVDVNVTVSDPVLVTTAGAAFAATKGKSTGNVVLATFTDPGNTLGTVQSDYSASVDWGDGTSVSPDIVPAKIVAVTDASGDPTGTFDVIGKHTYKSEKLYTATVSIIDGDNPAQVDTVPISVLLDASKVDNIGIVTLNPGQTKDISLTDTKTDTSGDVTVSRTKQADGNTAIQFSLDQNNPTGVPQPGTFFDLQVQDQSTNTSIFVAYKPGVTPSSNNGKFEIDYFNGTSWVPLDTSKATVTFNASTGILTIQFKDNSIFNGTVFSVALINAVAQTTTVSPPVVQANTSNQISSDVANGLQQTLNLTSRTQLTVSVTTSQDTQLNSTGNIQGNQSSSSGVAVGSGGDQPVTDDGLMDFLRQVFDTDSE